MRRLTQRGQASLLGQGWPSVRIYSPYDRPPISSRALCEQGKTLEPSYRFGRKRPTLSEHDYRAFARDNVALTTGPIGRP